VSKLLHANDIAPETSLEVQRELVKRIAESRHFKKSPRVREFLLFITGQTFLGHAGDLTEHLIGCQIFGRTPGYNHAEDNIVRVTARQLRSKLQNYFAAEGAAEDLILEVPKGGYIPVFRPMEADVAPQAGVSRRGLVWLAAVASAFAIAALAFAIWMWRENRVFKVAGAAGTTPTLVSELLLNSNKPVTVVIADFGLVMMESLGGRAVPLEEYVKRDYLDGSRREKTPGMMGVWRTLATRQITSFDDMTLGSSLLKAHPDRRDQILMQHSRTMNVRDFKTGNFIIQGGNLATPWTSLFDQKVNFRLEPVIWGPVFVSNTHPQPGERPSYVSARGNGRETSYARIALVPNLSGTGKVLLVAGCNIAGNEAAAEFLLSPASVALVKHTLGLSDLSQVSYFELLLEISTLDGADRGARILAFRR
jgi:hypothetical protein